MLAAIYSHSRSGLPSPSFPFDTFQFGRYIKPAVGTVKWTQTCSADHNTRTATQR